jgi:hypothetical protein
VPAGTAYFNADEIHAVKKVSIFSIRVRPGTCDPAPFYLGKATCLQLQRFVENEPGDAVIKSLHAAGIRTVRLSKDGRAFTPEDTWNECWS